MQNHVNERIEIYPELIGVCDLSLCFLSFKTDNNFIFFEKNKMLNTLPGQRFWVILHQGCGTPHHCQKQINIPSFIF